MEESKRITRCSSLEGRWKSSKSLNRLKKKKKVSQGSREMSWAAVCFTLQSLKAQEAPDIPGSGREGNKLRRFLRKFAYEAIKYSDSFLLSL